MKKQKQRGHKEGNPVNEGTPVTTVDGPGRVIGVNMRKNTNGGPGVHQYCVRLDDGRVRHYNMNRVNDGRGERE